MSDTKQLLERAWRQAPQPEHVMDNLIRRRERKRRNQRIGAGALAAPAWVPIVASDGPWILAIGLAGWAGQHLITEAFRLAPASLVAPYEYTALLWGIGIDWAVWQVLPGARMLVGAGIVVSAGLYLLDRGSRRQASAA